MNELDDLLAAMLGADPSRRPRTDEESWQRLREAGLDRVGVDEDLGGVGGGLRDAATVLVRTAQVGMATPLTSSLLPLAALSRHTGREVPDGVVVFHHAGGLGVTAEGDGFRLRGRTDAQWLTSADVRWLLVDTAEGALLVRLGPDDWRAAPGDSPRSPDERGRIGIDAVVARADADRVDQATTRSALLLASLGRSCETLGALRGTVTLTAEYVQTRQQFSRPLFALQAVRHRVAELIEHLSACEAAVAQSLDALDRADAAHTAVRLAVDAAAVQSAVSADVAARGSHQLHGALGMTAEYPLHRVTRLLWAGAGREDSAAAAAELATLALGDSDGGLWRLLTGIDDLMEHDADGAASHPR